MDLKIETLALEQRIKKVGRIDDFCALAKIDRATWHRWKNGDIEFPNMGRWLRVRQAVTEMELLHEKSAALFGPLRKNT